MSRHAVPETRRQILSLAQVSEDMAPFWHTKRKRSAESEDSAERKGGSGRFKGLVLHTIGALIMTYTILGGSL